MSIFSSACQAAHGERKCQPIASAAHTSTKSRWKNDILVSKDNAGADRSKKQMKKRLKKRVEGHQRTRDDVVVEISMDDVLELPSELSTRDAESQAPKVKSVNPHARLKLRRVGSKSTLRSKTRMQTVRSRHKNSK
ncbi:hypothetical protein JB92DRAFT_2914580 [Gautieria morchelliformis]|nr:hypothetical protein JB92DRAFT_2914580 [Gautieria morchelliformis]